MGSSVSSVCEFYDVGKSTVYDLIKKKDEYYEAYANSDCKHKLKFRITVISKLFLHNLKYCKIFQKLFVNCL